MHITNSVYILCALLPAIGFAAPARSVARAPTSGKAVAVAASTSRASIGATQSVRPVVNPKLNGGNPPIDIGIAKESIPDAVNGWQADTGIVSTFVNMATSLQGDEYTQAAIVAFNAEVNELNHKAVLDKNLDPKSIQAANDTLATQGAFQAVVDSLQAMISEGPETAQLRVDEINNNRCVNVLPNINAYFSAAGLPASTASVPTGCAHVAATNTGSVVPTEAAGNGKGDAPANNPGTTTSASASSASSTSSAASDSSSASSASSTSPASAAPSNASSASSPTTTAAAGGNGNVNDTENADTSTTTTAKAARKAAAKPASALTKTTTRRA